MAETVRSELPNLWRFMNEPRACRHLYQICPQTKGRFKRQPCYARSSTDVSEQGRPRDFRLWRDSALGPAAGDGLLWLQIAISLFFLLQRQEGGVAAGGGGVDREGVLGGEAVEVARAAGFGAGAGEPLAAERLHPHDGADHVAVDVAVADLEPLKDVAHGLVDAAVDARRQAVAGGGDLVEHLVEPVGRPAHDMQDRAEDLAREPLRAIDLEGAG